MSLQEDIESNLKTKDQKLKIKLPLTLESVVTACGAIEHAGERATQARVRSAIGGGSFTDIGKLLNERREIITKDHELVKVEIPQEVNERVAQLLGVVWQSAIDESERRLSTQREELKSARDAFQRDIEDSNSAITMLEYEAKDYVEKIDSLEFTIEELNNELKKQKGESISLSVEISNLVIKLSSEEKTTVRLESDLERINNAILDEREKVTVLTEEKIIRIKEIEEGKTKLSEINSKFASTKKELADANTRINELTSLVSSLGAEQKTLDTINRNLDLQKEKLQISFDLSDKENKKINLEMERIKLSLEEKAAENGALKGEMKALREKINYNQKLVELQNQTEIKRIESEEKISKNSQPRISLKDF